MNSLTIIESWIASSLLGNATITGLVGSRIYLGEALESTEGLHIVYRYVDSRPFYTFGVKRNLSESYYDIGGWQKGPATTQVKTVANEIDNLFSDVKVAVFQGFEISCQTNRQLSFVDQSEKTETWRFLGGTYRIIANML